VALNMIANAITASNPILILLNPPGSGSNVTNRILGLGVHNSLGRSSVRFWYVQYFSNRVILSRDDVSAGLPCVEVEVGCRMRILGRTDERGEGEEEEEE
jgi:hypothetical protein